MDKLLVPGAIVIGALLILLAALYWLVPAGGLPVFIPGFEAGSTHIHFKHGLGSALLGLALFAFAWFRSGPKRLA